MTRKKPNLVSPEESMPTKDKAPQPVRLAIPNLILSNSDFSSSTRYNQGQTKGTLYSTSGMRENISYNITLAHDGCNFTSSNPNPEPITDTNPHDTLPYFIIPYSIILHSIIPYSMIEHSCTTVMSSMMQIALRPLFHHENTVPIFYCTNVLII